MTDPRTQGARRLTRMLATGLLFAIPFSKAAIEILFPLMLLTWWRGWHSPSRGPTPSKTPRLLQFAFYALLAYYGICATSIFSSTHPSLSLQGLIRKTSEYALLFVIFVDASDHPLAGRQGFRALMLAGWLVGLYAILQQWTGTDWIRGRRLEYSRMVGPYENPNDLATFLMVVVLVVIAQVLNRPAQDRLRLWTSTLLLLGCIAWTLSRGALIGLWTGLLFLLFFSGRKKIRMGAGLLLGTGLAFLFFRRNQLFDMLTFSDVGLRDRTVMWGTAWKMIEARPFLGQGLNTFMANFIDYAIGPNNGPAYAHNCFLQIAAETGIPGLVTFLLFLGALFATWRMALRKPDTSPEEDPAGLRVVLLGLAAGLLAFLVQSLFDTNLYALRQATLFWSLAGLATGLSSQLLIRREAVPEPSVPVIPVNPALNQQVLSPRA